VISRELFILWAYFQPIEIKFFFGWGEPMKLCFFWLFQKSTNPRPKIGDAISGRVLKSVLF
jgi:hypothetical protein